MTFPASIFVALYKKKGRDEKKRFLILLSHPIAIINYMMVELDKLLNMKSLPLNDAQALTEKEMAISVD